MITVSRMHGEFLRLLFLQAHRETTAHFIATRLPSQQNRSDNAFRFKRAAFYIPCTLPLALPFFYPSFFHTISLSPAFISARWAD